MHQDDDNYSDDYDYDDSQDDLESQYKKYFKFDPDAWDAWGKMLYDSLNDIVDISPSIWYVSGFPFKSLSFPVNSYTPYTGKDKNFQYLGNNYQNQQIWKTKYFVYDHIFNEYKNHIKSNPKHIVLQPHYYKGMFDILN
jgi:hypothetical protein